MNPGQAVLSDVRGAHQPAAGSASRPSGRSSGLAERLHLLAFAAVVAYAATLAAAAWHGAWIFRGGDRYVPADFVAFYAAGKLALAGEAASAYDWLRHHEAAVRAIGAFDSRLPWLNPPSFLLIVSPLALAPYPVAMLGWLGATLAAFAVTVGRIIGRPGATLAACAFPGVLVTAASGQASLLLAALMGGVLLLLRSHPVMAGVLLGVLTVKPQLGLLFPLALIACGACRTITSAAVTTAVLALISALLFGLDSWTAFATSLGRTGEAVLVSGQPGWGKMQSLYGALRHAGAPAEGAAVAQALFGVAVAAWIWRLWRGDQPYELKAAGLAVGVLLVQPYVFNYDSTILAIAMACLVRLGLRTGMPRGEVAVLTLASVAVLSSFITSANICFYATAAVGLLLIARARRRVPPPREPCGELTGPRQPIPLFGPCAPPQPR